jgi:hypothetical protein
MVRRRQISHGMVGMFTFMNQEIAYTKAFCLNCVVYFKHATGFNINSVSSFILYLFTNGNYTW